MRTTVARCVLRSKSVDRGKREGAIYHYNSLRIIAVCVAEACVEANAVLSKVNQKC